MRVVILADRSFAIREQGMLARIEVGLADEGMRVVHAVPESVMTREAPGASWSDASGGGQGSGAGGERWGALYSTRVGYADRGPLGTRLLRRSRAAALLNAIRASTPEHLEPGVDVVHVFGTDAWGIGADLAELAGAALVLELWRSSAIGAASGLAMERIGAGPPTLLVSEPSVEAGVRKRALRADVRRAPWGVHAPPIDEGAAGGAAALRPAYDGARPLAITVLADAGEPAAVGAVLAGINQALGAGRDSPAAPLIFLGTEDAVASREAAIWSWARRLGMLDRVTLVPDLEARREPLLQTDALILAEPGGRQRTLALEAMASGVPVLAVADPYVDSLIDRVTCRLVGAPAASAWAALLTELYVAPGGPDQLARLSRSAHAFVRANRTAAAQVGAILAAYAERVPRTPEPAGRGASGSAGRAG
jgi:hypothetical protein